MDETNVNNINGIPNFGHGLPEDGIVIAGVTDVGEVAPAVEPEAPIVEETPAPEGTKDEQVELPEN